MPWSVWVAYLHDADGMYFHRKQWIVRLKWSAQKRGYMMCVCKYLQLMGISIWHRARWVLEETTTGWCKVLKSWVVDTTRVYSVKSKQSCKSIIQKLLLFQKSKSQCVSGHDIIMLSNKLNSSSSSVEVFVVIPLSVHCAIQWSFPLNGKTMALSTVMHNTPKLCCVNIAL